jgi:hypothetical protein
MGVPERLIDTNTDIAIVTSQDKYLKWGRKSSFLLQ